MDIQSEWFKFDRQKILSAIGQERLKNALRSMLAIRHFETRAEAAYQQGHIGGFFHSYIGQEAIATSCVDLFGEKPWYTTTYRCHAHALLLGATKNEVMAELYGKVTGNAKGRGGSMHLFAKRLLGGYGIVGGHIPLAVGAAFSLKYLKLDTLSVAFLGDGAVVQGAVYESLNLAALWELPCIIVIENNQWGMGTAVKRAVAMSPIGQKLASAFNVKNYAVDGQDYLSCYGCFQKAQEDIKSTPGPVIIEAYTQRFKGHSISDPALYRTKEALAKVMERDPIQILLGEMIAKGWITQEEFDSISQQEKEMVLKAMDFALQSPYPDVFSLEEDVFAPS
jgi:pyruvate dehydrogenase E1 component alpha subunit